MEHSSLLQRSALSTKVCGLILEKERKDAAAEEKVSPSCKEQVHFSP